MINKAVPTTISFIPMLVYSDEVAPRYQRSTNLVELQEMQPPVNRGHNMIMHQIVVSSICI